MKTALLLLTILASPLVKSQEFPDDWLGAYAGTMVIGNLNRPNDTVPVSFEMQTIEPDSAWSYIMTFNSQKYGTIVKDYKIVTEKLGETQKYKLDENNGIVMEITLMNGTFYGMYEVLGNMYITTLRWTEDGIYFDLFGGSIESPTVTSAREEDEKVEASSYRPSLHQTVLLKPVE